MVEFGASIKLDSNSATQQMKKFADQTTKASKTLKQFQKEVRETSQGGSANVFRGYINSGRKANQQMLKTITLLHDQRKAFSKLDEVQQHAVLTADKLNRKYDESAANELKLINMRRELRIVTAAGLKTQKEADVILDRHALKLKRSTRSYRDNQAAKEKLIVAQKKESSELDKARLKYDKDYIIKKKMAKVTRELTLVLKNGGISQKRYNEILKKTRIETERAASSAGKLTSRYGALAKAARLVSIASRLLLGAYVAIRAVKMFTNFERTSEAIGLLSQKLTFLTGDSGGYQTLFRMTQEVGLAMKDASKIITRFAVVTNRAFSTETMADWSATLVKSARATGTSTQEMTGALIQITQAMSAGRLMGDEYRSVTENLPLLTVALRKTFKDSSLSLKELSSQGLITNKVMIDAFEELKRMLEGFPDTTRTVDAAIGRLSSSWDNFVAKVATTTFARDAMDFMSDKLTEAGLIMDVLKGVSDREDRNKARQSLPGDKTKLKDLKEQLSIEKDLFNQRHDITKSIMTFLRTDGTGLGLETRIESLNEKIAKSTKLLKEFEKGKSAALVKKQASDELTADAARERVEKSRLRTLLLIEKIDKGKAASTVNTRSEIVKKQIEERRVLGVDKGGLSDEEAARLQIQRKANTADKLSEIRKREISSKLRARNLSTTNNIEQIRDELATTGKLLSIQKNYVKNKNSIEASAAARAIAKEGGLTGTELDKISKTTPEIAKELTDSLEAKKIEDIRVHLDSVSNSIASIGIAGETSIAKLKGDITSALGLDKKRVVADFDKSVEELDKKLKSMASTKDKLGKSSEELDAIRQKELKTLERLRDAKVEDLDDKFTAGLESQFDLGAAATRKYNKELIKLNAAKIKLNLTDKAYNRQLRLLKEEMRDQINLTRAMNGEIGEFDQVILGLNKGIDDFRKSSKTAFEVAADSSNKFMDGLVDSIVIGGEEGKRAFADMTKSILQDIQRMILKSLALQAATALGFGSNETGGGGGGFLKKLLGGLGGGGSSGGGSFFGSTAGGVSLDAAEAGGLFNFFAKGGVQGGAGISSYSNSIVSKPTLFPFAKGTGLMGEAGAEAIMPLTRLANGNLGVGTAGGGGNVISNEINISIDIDQSGNSKEESQSSKEDGKGLANVISAVVQQELLKETRPGGLLSSNAK